MAVSTSPQRWTDEDPARPRKIKTQSLPPPLGGSVQAQHCSVSLLGNPQLITVAGEVTRLDAAQRELIDELVVTQWPRQHATRSDASIGHQQLAIGARNDCRGHGSRI